MVYSTDANKWRAYQFLDPFAAGSFVVCNKITSKFCRPDCDGHPITELRSEIKFVDSPAEAFNLGFAACEMCDPVLVPSIDVNLLVRTVKEINASIGFVPPLLDDDEDRVTETIKENLIGHNNHQRRMLVPANAYSSKSAGAASSKSAFAVSKNDSEHYKLTDLACRHLALAAALSIFSPASGAGANSPKSDEGLASLLKKKGNRKRRGGVLGFKELATKSKLSAWHFHRVFKSIVGLTPKTYGDMCWEFLEKEKEAMEAGGAIKAEQPQVKFNDSFTKPAPAPLPMEAADAKVEDSYITPPQTGVVRSPATGQKRARYQGAHEDMPSPKRRVAMDESPEMSPFTELRLDDDGSQFGFNSRAISVPNLSIYNKTDTLFGHLKGLDFLGLREDAPILSEALLDPYAADLFLNLPPDQDTVPKSHGAFASPSGKMMNISPLVDSNEISPATLNDDVPTSMFDMPDLNAGQDFSLGVDPALADSDLFNLGVVSDNTQKNEFMPELNVNDTVFAGVASDVISAIDY